MYCTKCGKQIDDNSNFCFYCGNRVGESNQQQVNQNTQQYKMYEQFSPSLGIGRKFVFTDKSLIYGNTEYLYSELSNINLLVVPTNAIGNGTANVVAKGKTLVLAYDFSQKERFLKAVEYANEQIDSAQGKSKKYKYVIKDSNGSRIEVFEDYLIFYHLPYGFTKMISNTMSGGIQKSIISFSDITDIIFTEPTELNEGNIKFTYKYNNQEVTSNSFPVSNDNLEIAKEILDFIESNRNKTNEFEEEHYNENDYFEPVKGESKTFPFCGKTLTINANVDVLNTYRLKYRALAMKYADKFEKKYNLRISDLDTFIEFFPKIYYSNLDYLLKISMDIFVSEGVWTVTYDSFKEKHINDFHLGIDDYNAMVKSIKVTEQNNQNAVKGAMGFVPHLRGGGFGLKGAMKGIATATAFNVARDAIESSAMKTTNLKPNQKNELYNRINFQNLFYRVFLDYWQVYLSLAIILKNNGKDIWFPSKESTQQASNIFQNLSNPRFPQERLAEVFLQILSTNPYKIEYHKFMVSKFNENNEASDIANYFGYTDFNNPRII